MVQPGVPDRNLDGLDVDGRARGPARRAGVLAAVEGCRIVFHVAALYRFWARDPADFYDVNVGGSLNVIEAARAAGVERLVYTSTVGTIGLDGTAHNRPADETAWARIDHLFGLYKQSKYVAEHEVLRAGAEGLPVVLVQPTLPLGPGDLGPTPTGKTVARLLERAHPGLGRHGPERRRRGRRRRRPPARGRARRAGPQLRPRRGEPRAPADPRRSCHGNRAAPGHDEGPAAGSRSPPLTPRTSSRDASFTESPASPSRAPAWPRPA